MTIVLQDRAATERVTIDFGDRGVTINDAPTAQSDDAIIGGQAIAQLLLGCETADEIIAVNGIDVRGDARRLLSILFPVQYPQMGNQAL